MIKFLETIKPYLIIILYIVLLPYLLYSITIFNDIVLDVLFKYILITIVCLWLFKKDLFKDLEDFIKNIKKYLKDNLQIYLMGFIGMSLSISVINLFIPGVPANEEINQTIFNLYPYLFFIEAVILGPICEELVFRKNFTTRLSEKRFIIESSIVFAYIHMINGMSNLYQLLFFIPYFLLALSFAKIYYKSKNIWVPITFHMIHNALTMLLLIIK